jgi:type IV secretory pathway VirB10-like protein
MQRSSLEHRKGIIWSSGMHFVFLMFIIFGLPEFLQPPAPPQPIVMAVDILPISQVTNAKPNDQPLAKEEKPTPPEPPKPTPPAPPEPTPPAPPEPPTPPEVKPEPAPEKKPEPAPEKKPEPKKEEKKPEPKKPEQKKATEKDLEKVLADLKKKKAAETPKEEPTKKTTEESGTKVKAENTNYDESQPLTMSEEDAIRSQMAKCWSVPAGAKDAKDLKPVIRVQLQQDGTVLSATVAEQSQGRYASDQFFRAAADSAIRAVKLCSPLKNLPPEKYGSWRDIEMTFDPSTMLF